MLLMEECMNTQQKALGPFLSFSNYFEPPSITQSNWYTHTYVVCVYDKCTQRLKHRTRISE